MNETRVGAIDSEVRVGYAQFEQEDYGLTHVERGELIDIIKDCRSKLADE